MKGSKSRWGILVSSVTFSHMFSASSKPCHKLLSVLQMTFWSIVFFVLFSCKGRAELIVTLLTSELWLSVVHIHNSIHQEVYSLPGIPFVFLLFLWLIISSSINVDGFLCLLKHAVVPQSSFPPWYCLLTNVLKQIYMALTEQLDLFN